MKKIRIFEAFSGIGAQNKSSKIVNLKNNDDRFEVVATCDWDVYATISYSFMHHNLTLNKAKKILNKFKLNNEEQINIFLSKYTLSTNSKYPILQIKRKSLNLKILLSASILISKNYCDIKKVDGQILDENKIDLLTYSFPCQGLSVANMGRDKGISAIDSSSHLVWEISRILKKTNNKPKYLLLENVKNLVNKYKLEYESWKKELSKLGYKTYTALLNARDHGSLQKRERVFAISVLKKTKVPFKNDVDFKKYINNIGQKRILENNKKEFFAIFDLKNKKYLEADKCLIKDTPSRRKIIEKCKNISDINKSIKNNFAINTLTTKQDRIPNGGYIEFANSKQNYLNYRFITPREAYKIMGFTDKDFDKLKIPIEEGILNNNVLWRQAGNSIDVNVLESVFQTIYEIDNMNGEKNEKK
ncbi:DNA (cytosine-5-)-methyltransferase [Mycoplasmopsis synoviae]